MSTWTSWLEEGAIRREDADLTRRLVPRGPDDPIVDLAGNDYLGLARHPAVTGAAAAAARTWGAGAGASRLVTGTLDLHRTLEDDLAAFLEQPAALVHSTGYHANLSAVTALADRHTLVVSDAHVHASLIDAVRLSRAEVTVTGHNDVAAVRTALAAADGRRALVLTESVYSVLGDAAPLVDLASACAQHDALLLVDEAHGVGIRGQGGRGLVHELGLSGQDHVVVTATLSKSLGAQGGAVLGTPLLIEHLVNRARPFIFDTALAPAPTAAATAALQVLRDSPDLPAVVHERIAALAQQLEVTAPEGAVLSIPMPSPGSALAAQAACLAEGIRVGCFRPPSVPDGISRLRVTASAGVPERKWTRSTDTLGRVTKEHR